MFRTRGAGASRPLVDPGQTGSMRVLALGIVSSALLAVSCANAGTDRAAPVLRISSDRPLVVVGTGFRPQEGVRLLVSPGPATQRVRAGQRGRFRVVLAAAMPRCGGIVVQAVGRQGSRATIDRTGPDCASVDW